MLGYNQLKAKGCVYEAYDALKIEDEILKALKNGLTRKQKDSLFTHIAQLCKYYLYGDFTNHDISYGKSINELTDFFKEIGAIAPNYIPLKKNDEQKYTENSAMQMETQESSFYLTLIF